MPRFQRSDRVRTGRDWMAVRKAGGRVSNEALVICVARAEKKSVGVVVGSNVGGAVVRNRIKRIFREYFRLNRGDFPGGACAIIAKPAAAKLTNDQLRESLKDALKKVCK